MYVPIAVHKNNMVLIDSMETFALYFCSSVKQKMKPTIEEVHDDYDAAPATTVGEGDVEEDFGSQYSGDDSYCMDMGDEDDI